MRRPKLNTQGKLHQCSRTENEQRLQVTVLSAQKSKNLTTKSKHKPPHRKTAAQLAAKGVNDNTVSFQQLLQSCKAKSFCFRVLQISRERSAAESKAGAGSAYLWGNQLNTESALQRVWQIGWQAADLPAGDHKPKNSEWPVWVMVWMLGMCQGGRDASGKRKQNSQEHPEPALAENLGNKGLLRVWKTWWLPRGGKGFIRTLRVQ